MKRSLYFLCLIFLAGELISCAAPEQKTAADKSIKPGERIGEMTLERGSPILPYPYIWFFCENMPDEQQPGGSATDCEVPRVPGISIDFGWLAKETKFAANWDAITWDASLDDRKIDLAAFGWYEFDHPAHGEGNRERRWILDLKNPSPGKHTLQISWKTKTALNDGFNIYRSGFYLHAVNFTVLEKVTYPALPSNAETGQHLYTSQKAQLDFLLHLPDDYGKDPQREWPLIVYLHGAHLRGATLELLMQEPLPKYAGEESEFPFIVISPLGDGSYEFWAKDEMIKPLFVLLDEIQSKYSIDSKSIYLTGNDMGGNGAWAVGLRNPGYFAALVPIAGYFNYPFEIPENICGLKNVPVWAFHGGRDEIVPVEVEQELVNALNACGGNARITVSPDMKADVPYKVYANPELYAWLLAQKKK